MAHSNFVELALLELGYTDVFPFVGSDTKIRAPSGRMVFPLVTGTFRQADMVHSVLGSLADYLSENSIAKLKEKVQKVVHSEETVGRSDSAEAVAMVKGILSDMVEHAGDRENQRQPVDTSVFAQVSHLRI